MAPDAAAQSRANIVPVHKTENVIFSTIFWAIPIIGLAAEILMSTTFRSPYGMNLGLNLEQYSMNKPEHNMTAGTYVADQLQRIEAVANMPFLLYSNFKASPMRSDPMNHMNRYFDSSNSEWENPFAKNTRMGVGVVCNPAFSFSRMMSEGSESTGAYYMENVYNKGIVRDEMGNVLDDHIWWDMRRADFVIGEGMVSFTDTKYMEEDFYYDFWLRYRDCIVQGGQPVNKSSENYQMMKAYGLLHSDILPAKNYKSLSKMDASMLPAQEHIFLFREYSKADGELFWGLNRGEDLTSIVNDDSMPIANLTSCSADCVMSLENAPTNAASCACSWAPGLNEFIYKIDSYQKMMHLAKDTNRLPVQLAARMHDKVGAAVHLVKALWKQLLMLVIFAMAFYSPSPAFGGIWLANRWIIRLIAYQNIMNYNDNFLTPISSQFKNHCFKRHAKSLDARLDKSESTPGVQLIDIPSLPGLECEWAPGVNMLAWQIILNWMYIIVTFFWRTKGQHTRSLVSVYDRLRFPMTANRRGVYPVSMVGVGVTVGLISAIGYGDGFQTIRHFAVNGYQKTKIENVEKQGCDKGGWEACLLQGMETNKYIPVNAYEWPTLAYLCWRSVPTFWKAIPSCAAMYLIYFLSTPFNGVMTNKLQKIHSTRPRLVMISLAALLPYYFVVLYAQTFNIHFEEHVNLPFGINFKLSTPNNFDGWSLFAAKFLVADVPRYMVVFVALSTIGEALNTQIYFFFKVFTYGVYTFALMFATSLYYWNSSCGFGYSRTRVHNHALAGYADPSAAYPHNFLADAADMIHESTSLSGTFASKGLCEAGIKAQSWMGQMVGTGAPYKAAARLKTFYEQFNERKMVLAPMIYVPDGNDRTNMTHSLLENEDWQSTYLINVFTTLNYFAMQTIANAGLADISPSSVNETIFSIFLFLFSLFLVQNKFNNVLARMVSSNVIAKLGFTKNSQACLFVDSTAENRHRIQHTSSLLWRYWELWKGICPHSDISTDFDVFPRSVRQEVSYMVLEELCCRNKSVVLSKLNQAELKHVSEGLNYHLMHSNDVLMNSLECQQFVMIVKSGDWCVCGLDDSEMTLPLDDYQVYFEKECLLGAPANYSVRCFSDYGECYTIPRQYMVDAVFGSKNIAEINKVLGIDQTTASILAREQYHLEEFGLNLPDERIDDCLHRPIVLSRQHLIINKYNDIENYKLETVRFLHNYESLLYFDKMEDNVRRLMYQHEMITNKARMQLRSADIRRQDYTMGHAFDIANELDMKSSDGTYQDFVNQMMGNLNADSEASSDSRHLSMKLDMMDHQADLDMDRNQGYMLELTPGTEEVNVWNYFIAAHSIFSLFYVTLDWAFLSDLNMTTYTGMSSSVSMRNLVVFDMFAFFDLMVHLHTGFEDRTNSISWNPSVVWGKMPLHERLMRLIGALPVGFVIFNIFFIDLDQNQVTRAFRMMKVVYYYYVPTVTLAGRGNKLYGTFTSTFISTGLDIYVIIQIIACCVYASNCSCSADHKERFFLSGNCYAGSWAWFMLGEDRLRSTVSDALYITPPQRWLQTIIWNLKIMTAFGSNDIVPSLSFTRAVLTILMFLGIILLCKIIAIYTAFSGSSVKKMVMSEIKSHLVLIDDRLADSKFHDQIAQTKRQVHMQYGGFKLPGDFDKEDTLFPIDRIFMKAESFKSYLSHIQLFIDLPNEIQHHIAMSKSTYQYPNNQIIIHEGDRVGSLFHIKLGTVEIRKNNECVGYLEAGNTFNMLEMMGDVPSKYEYRTSSGCEISDWSREDLEKHMHTCWSPFTASFQRACAEKAQSIELKPFAYDVAALEKTQQDKAVKTLNDLGHNGAGVDSNDTISPESEEYLTFAYWNNWRILVNVCLSCFVSCIFYQKIVVVLLLVVFDLGGVYNMYMSSRLQRKDQKTSMYNRNAHYAKQYYMANGLSYDVVTVILPLLLDLVTGWNNGFTFIIRSFQMSYVYDYFNWDADKVASNRIMAPVYSAIFKHVWLISFASALGTRISAMEAVEPRDDKMADAGECVYPIGGGDVKNPTYCLGNYYDHGKQIVRDPIFGIGIFVNDDDRFDRIDVPWGSKTFGSPQGGWVNQIYSASVDSNDAAKVALGGSSFAFGAVDFTNTWHIFCSVFYYWSNCATNTGATIIYPMHFSFSQVIELAIQLYGIIIVVQICTAFTDAGEIIDARRSAVEQTFYKLTSYLKNIVQGGLDKNIIARIEHQYNMNFEKNTANIEQQIFNGVPPCLKQDVSRELYGDILTKTFLKGASEQQVRELAVHVETVATLPGTFIHQGQITDQAFFIADGKFTVNGEPLPQGSSIVSRGRLCCSEIVSLDEGIIYSIALDTVAKHHQQNFPNAAMKYGISKPDTGCVAKEVEVTYHTYYGFLGICSWIMAMANFGRFGFAQDYSDMYVQIDLYLALAMFVYTFYNFYTVKGDKFADFGAYDMKDQAALVASVPLAYAPVAWITRIGYFIVEHTHIYAQAWRQLETNIYYYRIVKFSIYNLCICTFFTSLHMYFICPSSDTCELEKSMLIDLNDNEGKLISNTDASGAHQTAAFAVAERKSSDFLIYIQLFYSTMDSFTSTGYGNIMPRMPVNMLLRGLTCWLGRIYFGVYLGLGSDVLATQIDAVHSEYLLLRARIERYLVMTGLDTNRHEYICSILDAQYQKTRYLDIKTTLNGSVMMPALRRQFYDSAMGACVKASAVFKGVTDDCIAEICERALNIEHYFTGSVIQECRTPFLGTCVILDGSCTVNSDQVMIDGDTMYGGRLFDSKSLANQQIKAFSDCEIIRVDSDALSKVLDYFPDDKATIMNNIASC